MSNRQPNFKNNEWVEYNGRQGQITKVWTTDPRAPKYTVKFSDGNRILSEGQLKRA